MDAGMTVFSAFAYALAVTLAAACCRRLVPGAAPNAFANPFAETSRQFSAREAGACLCVLAAFLFIPPGSLPPFWNVSWGGAAFLVLAGLSCIVSGKRGFLTPFFAMLLAACVFAWHAWERGLPGSCANIGTFVAMPVWSVASSLALCGFAPLAVGTAFAVAAFALWLEERRSLAAAGQYLTVCALWVTLFFPVNFAPFAPWPDMVAAGCDFLLFWLKTLLLCAGLRRLGRFRHAARIALCCNAAGAALVLCSLYM